MINHQVSHTCDAWLTNTAVRAVSAVLLIQLTMERTLLMRARLVEDDDQVPCFAQSLHLAVNDTTMKESYEWAPLIIR